jgi:hypothetical protein
MDLDAILEEWLCFEDWIGLWMLFDDVAQHLDADDPSEVLEPLLTLVRGLLEHGFLAGDSPAHNDGVHFRPWPNQDPEAVVGFICRQWPRDDFPSWGDGPWFALPRGSRH